MSDEKVTTEKKVAEVLDAEGQEVAQATFEGMISEGQGSESVDTAEREEVVSSKELVGYSAQPDFDSNDILIPRLRLGQGLTPEVMDNQAKVGQWILTGMPPTDTVAFLPLRFCRKRILRLSKDDPTVTCSSQGAVVGEGEPGGSCKECPNARWTTVKSGARKPPICTFIYSYIGWSITHECAVMLEFKRTALPAGKTLNTIVARHGIGELESAVELGSNRVQKNNRTFYLPVVRSAPLTSKEVEAIKKQSMF